MAQASVDVLIAGCGPVGLTVAVALAGEGVGCLVVDEADTRPSGTRCPVLWPTTLTALATQGLPVAEFRARSVALATKVFHLGADSFGHGMDEPDAPWPSPLSGSQDVLEALLLERVRQLGVPIRYRTRVCALELEAGRLRVRLAGEATPVSARYVVLALGAGPAAAELAGIDYRGPHPRAGSSGAPVTVQADVLLAPGALPDGEEHIFLAQDRHVGFVPLPSGRHRAFVTCADGQRRPPAQLAQDLSGIRVSWQKPLWTTRPTSAIADSFHHGRCFLVGECAKTVPQPVHGLNAGIQDAVNLGWKLGAVLRGTAAEHLLDTYTRERHAVAVQLLAKTERIAGYGRGADGENQLRGRVRQSQHDVRTQPAATYSDSPLTLQPGPDGGIGHGLIPGAALPDLPVVADGRDDRLFGLLTTGRWTLLHSDDASAAAEELRGAHPDVVTRAVRPPEPGSLPALCLVRPDGYIAATGSSSDAPRLRRHLARISRPMADEPSR